MNPLRGHASRPRTQTTADDGNAIFARACFLSPSDMRPVQCRREAVGREVGRGGAGGGMQAGCEVGVRRVSGEQHAGRRDTRYELRQPCSERERRRERESEIERGEYYR